MAADQPYRTLGVPRAYAWPLVVLTVCLGLTGLTWRAESRDTQRETRTYFQFRVRDAQQRIEQRLKTYQQVLRDAQGLVTTAPVDRQGFRKFVATMNLGANYPGIQGVGLALHVPARDLAGHLAAVRRDGLPGYALRPEGHREAYAPVVYLEPATERNQKALGFDLRSEPVRRAALDLARDLDDLTLTGKLRLVQEPAQGGQAGFIMFLPVYHLGPGAEAPHGDPAQRRAALRGWINAPFRMDDLMAGVFGERAHELDIQIYDGAEAVPEALMFATGAAPAANPDTALRTQVLLETGHRQWLLKARALPALEARLGPGRAGLMLRGGLLVSALLTLLTWALARGRQRAVLLAEARETRFKALMQQANDSILLLNPAGKFLEANDRAVAHFGYSQEEFRTLGVEDLHPEQDRALAQQAVWKVLATGSLRMETVHRRKDGALMDSELSAKVVQVGGEQVLLCLIQDITAKKRAQNELNRILREQEIILDNANVGITRVVDRCPVWFNPWFAEVFGFSREDVGRASTRRLYATDEAFQRFGAEAYPVLARGEAFEAVVELLRPGGQGIWVHLNGKAIDPADLGQGSLWIVTDVTIRRQAEEALKDSELRFRTLFEAHSAVMLLIDPADGRIEDANPAAARFYGYGRDQLRAMNISHLNPRPPAVLGEQMHRAAAIQQRTFVFSHRLANGTFRTVEVNSSPIDLPGRRRLFSIIQDISERMRFEEQLLLRQAQLEDLNRSLEDRVAQAVAQVRQKDQMLITQGRQAAMGEMIGNIAHQWRQPLNALGMLLMNLRDAHRYQELDDRALDETLAKGNLLIQKMSSTISDFTDFFRPDKAATAFSALVQVRGAVALVDASFQAGNIAIRVEAAEDITLMGFPNEFSQVLLNLLANAKEAILKARPPAGLVTIRLARAGAMGSVRVQDNGGGVPEAILDKVFEPYFSTREAGTGLGLYMCKQIVERNMQGRITVQNVQGGAQFSILLALAGGPP